MGKFTWHTDLRETLKDRDERLETIRQLADAGRLVTLADFDSSADLALWCRQLCQEIWEQTYLGEMDDD